MKPSHAPAQLRRLAARVKDANRIRRLLSIAAVLDGISRADAAKIDGMDRQTLRDLVHRFNAQGPAGLSEIVEMGLDRAVDGVVRWHRVDSKRVVGERFGVEYHERSIGKLLTALGFSHFVAFARVVGTTGRRHAAR